MTSWRGLKQEGGTKEGQECPLACPPSLFSSLCMSAVMGSRESPQGSPLKQNRFWSTRASWVLMKCRCWAWLLMVYSVLLKNPEKVSFGVNISWITPLMFSPLGIQLETVPLHHLFTSIRLLGTRSIRVFFPLNMRGVIQNTVLIIDLWAWIDLFGSVINLQKL